MTDKIYFKNKPTCAGMLKISLQLRKMAQKLFYISATDKVDIKKRNYTDYQNIVEYNKIRSGIMDNICCNEQCCSYIHEEIKKLLFLEDFFEGLNRTIFCEIRDPSLMENFAIRCNNFVCSNLATDFEEVKAREQDIIDKFTFQKEFNDLANDLLNYAILDSYDIKYSLHRQKTAEAKKAIEENPAFLLVNTRRTKDGVFVLQPTETSEYPAHTYLKQMLDFVQRYHGVISSSTLVGGLHRYKKAYDALASMKNYKAKHPDRSTNKEKNQNNYIWAFGVVEYLANRPFFAYNTEDINNLKRLSRLVPYYYGFDNVAKAKNLLAKYNAWQASNREKN